MKTRFKTAAKAVASALASRQARGPELALARLILGAVGVKLGVDFARFV
jgi:hypothetical protein